ncbi:MAG: phage/plasmid primase, P4 family [Patescibacteria group bacterium]
MSPLNRKRNPVSALLEMEKMAKLPIKAKPIIPESIKPETSYAFLRMFKAHLLVYIPDGESDKALPVIHTYGVDGLTPERTAFPDPKKQKNGYGMFFSVNGFKSHVRTANNLYSLNGLFVDIDWPHDRRADPAELIAFKAAVMEDLCFLITADVSAFRASPKTADLPPPPTAIVETRNGYHVYWLFERPILLDDARLEDPEKKKQLFDSYRKMEETLIARFQGDTQAKDPTRVLRIPDSYHLKVPGDPYLVKLVHFDPDARHRFSELRKFWLENPNAINSTPTYAHGLDAWKESSDRPIAPRIASALSAQFQSAKSPNELLTPEDWKEINKRYPKIDRPSSRALMSAAGIPEGRRNKCLLMAASILREAGNSEADVLNGFLESGYNGLTEYEIKATVRSAFRPAEPYTFGWSDPVLAEYTPLEEVSKVVSAVKEYREEKMLAAGEVGKMAEVRIVETNDVVERTVKIGVPDGYLALSTDIKKNLYDHFEHQFIKAHPDIVFVEDLGFFRRMDNGAWYAPVEYQIIRGIVNRLLYDIGLADKRSTGQIAAKVESLQAFSAMHLTREEAERLNSTSPGNGTFLNLMCGILNIDSGVVSPHRKDVFFTHALDADPRDATCPNFEAFVSQIMASPLGDEDTRAKVQLLQEIAGYSLTPYVFLQRAFIFIGNGWNGKSTFTDILMRLLGGELASSLTFDDINNKNLIIDLHRKRLNVMEEIKAHERAYFDSEKLKKIVTGQELTCDRKYLSLLRFRPYATVIMNVNKFPRVTDTGFAFYRRFAVLSFNRQFLEGDKLLPDKLWKERSGILRWAMEGWQRLYARGDFELPQSSLDYLDEFKIDNSPLVDFILSSTDLQIEEVELTLLDDSRWTTNAMTVYEAYKRFTSSHGNSPKSYRSFLGECRDMTHSKLRHIHVTRVLNIDYIVGLRLRSSNGSPMAIPFNRV